MTKSCITVRTQAQADLIAEALQRDDVSFECKYYPPDPDQMCPFFLGFAFCVNKDDLPRLSAAVSESTAKLAKKPVESLFHWLLDQ